MLQRFALPVGGHKGLSVVRRQIIEGDGGRIEFAFVGDLAADLAKAMNQDNNEKESFEAAHIAYHHIS